MICTPDTIRTAATTVVKCPGQSAIAGLCCGAHALRHILPATSQALQPGLLHEVHSFTVAVILVLEIGGKRCYGLVRGVST